MKQENTYVMYTAQTGVQLKVKWLRSSGPEQGLPYLYLKKKSGFIFFSSPNVPYV